VVARKLVLSENALWQCVKKEIYPPKSALHAGVLLLGEKNGKKYGMRCDIVVNDVAETERPNLDL
jgi:hypothetical protein